MSYDGTRWSALGIPAAAPYEPPDRTRQPGWPQIGTAGARASMDVDGQLPPALPARPCADVRPSRGEQDRVEQFLAACRSWVPAVGAVASVVARAIGWFRR